MNILKFLLLLCICLTRIYMEPLTTPNTEREILEEHLATLLDNENAIHGIKISIDHYEGRLAEFKQMENSSVIINPLNYDKLLDKIGIELTWAKQLVGEIIADYKLIYAKLMPMVQEIIQILAGGERSPEEIQTRMDAIVKEFVLFEVYCKAVKLHLTFSTKFLKRDFHSLNKEIALECSNTKPMVSVSIDYKTAHTCNLQLNKNTHIRSIDFCPPVPTNRWIVHSHLVKELCELPPMTTFLNVIPVFYSNKTYKNIYCAICNEDPINLTTVDFFAINLLANSAESDRGAQAVSFLTEIYSSDYAFEPLESFSTTQCIEVIDTCPHYGIEACANSTSLVMHDGVYFKNQYCANCNGFDSYELKCLPDEIVSGVSGDSNALKLNIVEFQLLNDNKYNNYLEFSLALSVSKETHNNTLLRCSCVFEKSDFSLVSEMLENSTETQAGIPNEFCMNLFDRRSLKIFKSLSLTKKDKM